MAILLNHCKVFFILPRFGDGVKSGEELFFPEILILNKVNYIASHFSL